MKPSRIKAEVVERTVTLEEKMRGVREEQGTLEAGVSREEKWAGGAVWSMPSPYLPQWCRMPAAGLRGTSSGPSRRVWLRTQGVGDGAQVSGAL